MSQEWPSSVYELQRQASDHWTKHWQILLMCFTDYKQETTALKKKKKTEIKDRLK